MTASEFSRHRAALARALPSSLIVISANTTMQRVHDMAYPFAQDSHFYYLTGLESADWRLIIDTSTGDEWLVAPHVSEVSRTFDGLLHSEEASRISGVKAVVTGREAVALLRSLRATYPVVYTITPSSRRDAKVTPNPAARRMNARFARLGFELEDVSTTLTQLRAIKSDEEIACIKKAADITVGAFVKAKEMLLEISTEYELQAEFDYFFKKNNAEHAYDPIVAAGSRACTLHYIANNQPLPDNGLVVIDIGAKVEGYCADVTRTYAIGRPSERERAVHAAVERAHRDCIALLKPGVSVKEYRTRVDEIMQRELRALGLLKKPSDYRRYFPHAISHGLGIDVHDSLGAPTYLQAGMVLTVEPGIYIPEEGIGVRIEDDILITESGIRNLTGHLSTSL